MERPGTVAIVGVGLIGGSIGLALRKRSLARHVVGIGRDSRSLDLAISLGALDEGTTDLAAGVAGAEIVVVCTPVTRIAEDIIAAAKAAPRDVLLTDAGSTKRGLVGRIEREPAARDAFVGAHPIAGSERKGVAHAMPDLFEGRLCVLTPTVSTPDDRVARAKAFWSSLGCRVECTSPEEHDRILSLTSHLPHVVASALAAAIPAGCLPMAAGAYRDGTRVAASDGSLWAGIFRENREHLLAALDGFEERIEAFRRALESSEPGRLERCWEEGRSSRVQYREADGQALLDS
ncbi:prephenate dehydrogenase/arogenate dehydrogenase family protein [Isosphaeraceae bacterium EP7]